MQTTTLSFSNLHNHGELFANLFRARKQSFIVQKNWDLPEAEGMEFDQYDTPQSRWIAIHDLGQVLGTGAYLSNLVRTWTGPFRLEEAWTLADLEQALGDDPAVEWESLSIHPDTIVQSWPAIVLDSAHRTDWLQGRLVAGSATHEMGGVRAYDDQGNWLGIGRGSELGVRPWKVVRNDGV